jgi:hypothetical protein
MTTARRLAAILAADVAGYSWLMGQDDAGTAKVVRERREEPRPIATASSRPQATVSCLRFALSLLPSNAPSRSEADCRAATSAFPEAHGFSTA